MRTETSTDLRHDCRREQLLRELASSLCDLVEQGEMTDMEAMDWYNSKADQWSEGVWN